MISQKGENNYFQCDPNEKDHGLLYGTQQKL